MPPAAALHTSVAPPMTARMLFDQLRRIVSPVIPWLRIRRRNVAVAVAGLVLIALGTALLTRPQDDPHREQLRTLEASTRAAREQATDVEAAVLAGPAHAEAERQSRTKRDERATADAAREAMLAANARGPATPVTPVASPPPSPPSVAPRDVRADIRAALQTYVRAIQTKDLALLRQVRAGLSEDEVRRWVRSFEIMRSRQVDLEVHDITVRADEAQVAGRRADVIVMQDGQRISTQSRFLYKLQRRGDGWVLHDLREMRTTPTARP